jgi:hypothetical protein
MTEMIFFTVYKNCPRFRVFVSQLTKNTRELISTIKEQRVRSSCLQLFNIFAEKKKQNIRERINKKNFFRKVTLLKTQEIKKHF